LLAGGLKRRAAFATRSASRTVATSMVTLAVMLGRSRPSGFGTSMITG
jgi:hypothetical protein